MAVNVLATHPLIHSRRRLLLLAIAVAGHGLAVPLLAVEPPADSIRWWVSTEDSTRQLAEQRSLSWQDAPDQDFPRIDVDPSVTFQTMLGMGASLEPSTCSNLWHMTPADRERTMERLVSPTAGIGMNLMRICIGTPDFTGDPWYSYDDVPAGETDPELKRFSIEKDRAYILPVLKRARRRIRTCCSSPRRGVRPAG